MVQDGVLKRLEFTPGFQTQVVDQQGPQATVDIQGVRLATAAVERQHELATHTFAQRLGLDHRLQCTERRLVPPALQFSLEVVLDRVEPRVPRGGELGPAEPGLREVGEGLALPQVQRALEGSRRLVRESRLKGGPPLGDLAMEHMEIDLVRVDLDHVSRCFRHQHLGPGPGLMGR